MIISCFLLWNDKTFSVARDSVGKESHKGWMARGFTSGVDEQADISSCDRTLCVPEQGGFSAPLGGKVASFFKVKTRAQTCSDE
jgi:hypothetical protein